MCFIIDLSKPSGACFDHRWGEWEIFASESIFCPSFHRDSKMQEDMQSHIADRT